MKQLAANIKISWGLCRYGLYVPRPTDYNITFGLPKDTLFTHTKDKALVSLGYYTDFIVKLYGIIKFS